MKRYRWGFAVLLAFGLAAALQAADGQATIDDAYQKIQGHVCTDVGKQEQDCQPALDADERWAFVTTWCRRQPDAGAAICPAVDAISDQDGPVVLAFNHDARAWRAIHGLAERDVDVDANGIPKALTRNGRKVIAAVESTNPLVYEADAGPVTETDAAVVANLKALFAKLGPALLGVTAQAGPITNADEKEKVRLAIKAGEQLQCLIDQWDAARLFTQQVEVRKSASYLLLAAKNQLVGADNALLPADQQPCIADRAALAPALEVIETASKIPFCIAEVEAIVDWMSMSPTDVAALRKEQGKIDLDGACADRLETDKQARDLRLDGLEAGKVSAALWLQSAAADRTELKERRQMALAVADAAALLTTEKRNQLLTVFNDLEKFETRLIASTATADSLADRTFDTAEVADFLVVRHGPIVVAWTKDRARTLTVVKRTSFANLSTLRPDTLATSYEAASLAASLIDMTVAVTHTDVVDPVFGAVTEPAPTAADPNATRKVIAQTDEKSRSGKLAVMVALPLYLPAGGWTRRWGLELGAGASTSTPALFLGVTTKLGGGIRVGGGYTWQQVKELDGQQPGDPIAADTDIKRRDTRDGGWYLSLSLSLESVGSLFKAD